MVHKICGEMLYKQHEKNVWLYFVYFDIKNFLQSDKRIILPFIRAKIYSLVII